eukprot:Skav212161  [mRNA]  locus=scaffold754:230334:231152:+ [translate_table: standard]
MLGQAYSAHVTGAMLFEPCVEVPMSLSRASRMDRIGCNAKKLRFVAVLLLFLVVQGPQCGRSFVAVQTLQRPNLRLCLRFASVGEAVDEALRSSTFPPPDWLRLSTVATSDAAAQRVGRAVFAISEGLRLEQKPVERLRNGSTASVQSLALWVPPRSMLLVSSMIGEALGDEPMILVENLDLDEDDEAEFFLGELTGPSKELRSLATEMLEKRYAAVVDLDEDGTAAIHTTSSGKALVESLISSSTTAKVSSSWSAVGGNSEYLSWIASQVA